MPVCETNPGETIAVVAARTIRLARRNRLIRMNDPIKPFNRREPPLGRNCAQNMACIVTPSALAGIRRCVYGAAPFAGWR
jgi:hypothetical protein